MNGLPDVEIEDIHIDETGTKDPAAAEGDSKGILKIVQHPAHSSDRIFSLSSSLWYVEESVPALSLADALGDDTIPAVGVVDASGRVKGIVIRRDFFNLLSRPFGRDVTKKHIVKDVTSTVKTFHWEENIFFVSSEIQAEIGKHENCYFLLKTDDERFAGIFSSRDMLMYLSDLTMKDLELARKIQTRLVKEYYRYSGYRFEVVASSIMAKGVGGDYYGVREYAPERWIIMLCDVSGKGMAASLITSMLSGMMETYDFSQGLEAFITGLNRTLVESFEQERFITGVFCLLNAATGKVVYCDMGHSYKYLLRNGSVLEFKNRASNYPVGITGDLPRPEASSFTLQRDDIFFLLTDGILEQLGPDGDDYSFNRLSSILKRHGSGKLETLKIKLLEDFHRFRGNRPLHDDTTFLLLRYRGKKPG